MKMLLPIYLLIIVSLISYSAFADSDVIDPEITPTFTLECDPPTEREDGSDFPVNQAGSYTFYYGTESGDYQNELGTQTCEVIVDATELDDATYFFVVTVKDLQGRESLYSEEIVKVVQRIPKPKAPTWK